MYVFFLCLMSLLSLFNNYKMLIYCTLYGNVKMTASRIKP